MPLCTAAHPLGPATCYSAISPQRPLAPSRPSPCSPAARFRLPCSPSPTKSSRGITHSRLPCSTGTALLSSSSLSSADSSSSLSSADFSSSLSATDYSSSQSSSDSSSSLSSADCSSSLSSADASSSLTSTDASFSLTIADQGPSPCEDLLPSPAPSSPDPYVLAIHLPPDVHTSLENTPAYQTVDDITIHSTQTTPLPKNPAPVAPSATTIADSSTALVPVLPLTITSHNASSNNSSAESAATLSAGYAIQPSPNSLQPAGELAQAQQATEDADSAGSANLWALFMLFMAYVHQSASGTAVPSMLPLISPDLSLNDLQGALLTTGYFYLYAIALVPVGLAADKTSRPLLLSAGLTLWSGLCMKMGQVHNFNELLIARVGFAAAQATQNPISFALIPELFPKNKTTALAVYNCAQYVGRALSFAAVLLARSTPAVPAVADQVSVQMLPLDQLDFHHTSLLYTQGNMAAVLPIYDYNYQIIEYGPVQEAAWRHLLWYIGIPGLVLAGLLAVTVREPRSKKAAAPVATRIVNSDSESDSEAETCVEVTTKAASPTVTQSAWSWMSAMWSGFGDQPMGQSGLSVALAGQAAASAPADMGMTTSSSSLMSPSSPTSRQFPSFKLPNLGLGSLGDVWNIPGFKEVTLAAAMNDVGCYALIAWHSTFYERVYHLDASTYAPLLAAVMPIGGIIGGVGGGWLADYLDKRGGRAWLTVGASLMAAPLMAESLLAPTYQISFLALLCGFAMSEAWRSPAAIMIRTITPSSQASTGTALYICIRNLVGGVAPLAVAKLSEQVGLQKALLVAPGCYVISGLIFLLAEDLLAKEKKKN